MLRDPANGRRIFDEYPTILRAAWCYVVAFVCALAGVVLMRSGMWLGAPLGFGPMVVLFIDVCVRAPSIRRQALEDLETRVPEMSAEEVEEHLGYIRRYYGGHGLPSVRRRVARIHDLATRRAKGT